MTEQRHPIYGSYQERVRAAVESDLLNGFLKYQIPEHIRDGITRYVLDHIRPGHFLTAYLKNDLREAVGRADAECAAAFCRLSGFLYNYTPGNCYGSPEAVEKWLEQREADDARP